VENERNHVFTEIEINAATDQVWSVLTDWKNLKDWSSSFVGISTEKMVEGEVFISYFRNPLTGGILELEHVCTDYEEGKKFGWSGNLIGRTKDHHIYSLEPTQNGKTIFRQEDGIHGAHSKLLNLIGKHKMIAMYNKFNRELKEQVESTFPRNDVNDH